MNRLTTIEWKAKYSPDNCSNIVKEFYIPALCCAQRYWRTTGYFRASALAIAMRGIEGLLHNQGRMRLIVGCTLNQPEADAISRGQKLRAALEQHLEHCPLDPPDKAAHDALELLAWMVQKGFLDVQVAVPCDQQKQPIGGTAIFHEKAGVIEDIDGARIAFNGSINETRQGWTRNWDSFHVYTSWKTVEHVDEEEQSFLRLWNRNSSSAVVISVPDAIRLKLLTFAPFPGELPRRLSQAGWSEIPESESNSDTDNPLQLETIDARAIIWNYIEQSPKDKNYGERVGEVTCVIDPWPHQVRAFKRMWDNWPPKLLIADEVGLGKTIQAGLILRQAWLSGLAKRILVMTPAAVLKQWQIELREKFNLNWPIYDGKALNWYPSPGFQGPTERLVERTTWHQESCVLVSSHLMRRQDRTQELLQAEKWDLVILDEAHHARRSGVQSGNTQRGNPNRLLSLMQRLRHRTQGLVLLTATPMQVDPIEVWDLLQLFDIPREWTAEDFLRFFEITAQAAPSEADLAYIARLFRAIENQYGKMPDDTAEQYVPQQISIRTRKILRALRSDQTSIPIKKLETVEREAAIRIMQAYTPIKLLISRHTRDLLREYYRQGKLSTPIATRKVQDEFNTLSPAERQVYDAVEDYISTTYNNAAAGERNAVGFVMTIYRKRLASSFYALANTLSNRLSRLQNRETVASTLIDNLSGDDELKEQPDEDEAAQLEAKALNLEESADLSNLLAMVNALPTDTKAQKLKELINILKADGYSQIIIFTQFTDTMDFLRRELEASLGLSIMCFSGRGGELRERDGTWRIINREETKRRFRNQEAEIMLCTDAAAEGLNFQFCGALINYDMPWNPMRVEQRIGRIDRLGQSHEEIRIYNLHYRDTVETDVFIALSDRIQDFQNFVGRLQPILSRLPGAISNLVLSRREDREVQQENLLSQLEEEANQQAQSNITLDTITTNDEELVELERPDPAYTMHNLQFLLSQPELLPQGIKATVSGTKDFAYLQPGMKHPIRVTTDLDYYDEHSDSVELWSPGNPLFPLPDYSVEEPVNRAQFLEALTSH